MRFGSYYAGSMPNIARAMRRTSAISASESGGAFPESTYRSQVYASSRLPVRRHTSFEPGHTTPEFVNRQVEAGVDCLH